MTARERHKSGIAHFMKEADQMFSTKAGFPLGLENQEKWEGIFQSGKSQGILNRLEKSGKITQNTGKLKEFQTNIIFYFLVIFKLTVYYFVEMHQIFSYKINF